MTHILVIEDQDVLRSDLMEMLHLEGFEVEGAQNGRIGLEAIAKRPFDLILCDVMMPEVDGYGVLEGLRANPERATTPFIFLTAQADRVNVREGMSSGADDYITKPFLVEELMATIQTQLAKRREFQRAASAKVDQLREHIATALPHEFHTPLNGILGYAEMLIRDAGQASPAQIVEWATFIQTSGRRLYRLVENYLAYTRLQITRAQPDQVEALRRQTSFGAAYLLEQLGARVAERYQRHHDLQLQLQGAPILCISHSDLAKLLEEVLDNAFKFSQAGQRVAIRTETTDAQWFHILIENEGSSIKPEQATQIGAYIQFDRWLYEQQGIGLGLAIVRDILALYEGRLTLAPLASGGTLVGLALKIAP